LSAVPWAARARLTTGRAGPTHIGTLRECVERWQALGGARQQAVIVCEAALQLSELADHSKRLEAADIARLSLLLGLAIGPAE
jgi:hypothetical protein